MGLLTKDCVIISNGEADNGRMIEWAIFELRRNGKSLIQHLWEESASTKDAFAQRVLTALKDSTMSIYQVKVVQDQVGALVLNLVTQQQHFIYSRVFQSAMPTDTIFLARCVDDLTTLTSVASRISTTVLDHLRKFPAFTTLSDFAQDSEMVTQLARKLFSADAPSRSE